MIYSTVLLALAANGLWFNPLYENFIAPRKKRVELGKAPYNETEIENHLNKYPTDKFDREGVNSITWFKFKETNPFARKPFNCLLCYSFWFAFLFFAIHSLFSAEPVSVGYVITRLAACFAVSFLSVNIHKLVKQIPTSI